MGANESERLFFTADHHWGHEVVLQYCARPFKTVREMDEVLIERWNSIIRDDDLVYHLGDMFAGPAREPHRIRERLRGRIHLLRGNHDSGVDPEALGLEWVKDYHELIVEDEEADNGCRLIVLSHYPFREWNQSHHGSWHLHGHCHGSLPESGAGYSLDVGVDVHGFAPLSYSEVKTLFRTRCRGEG